MAQQLIRTERSCKRIRDSERNSLTVKDLIVARALKTTNKTYSPEIRNRTTKADFPKSKSGRVGGKEELVEATPSESELEKISGPKAGNFSPEKPIFTSATRCCGSRARGRRALYLAGCSDARGQSSANARGRVEPKSGPRRIQDSGSDRNSSGVKNRRAKM